MEFKVWTLARAVGPEQTYLFWAFVTTEEDRVGLWSAEIVGLEGRITAMGKSRSEAEHAALAMFKGMVDHAMHRGEPAESVTGTVLRMKKDVPLSEATKVFEAVEKLVREELEGDDDDNNAEWRSARMLPGGVKMPNHHGVGV